MHANAGANKGIVRVNSKGERVGIEEGRPYTAPDLLTPTTYLDLIFAVIMHAYW